VRGLAELGFSDKHLGLVRDILGKPRGIVLVTGPAGAGKATTLYSALAHLAGSEKNILTVEERVEHQIPTVRQTQIRPETGFTFGTAIRSLLRQAPDVIMISEMRDAETAQLALRAAQSGILVLSALPIPDTSAAVPRLIEMGLEPYLLASGLVGVIGQRLMRAMCADCKAPVTYPPDTLAKAGLAADSGIVFYKGQGCDACGGTGYRGHTGAFEVLVVDETINALIRERADSKRIKQAAVSAGMTTLVADAMTKAIFGRTTIEEALRIASE